MFAQFELGLSPPVLLARLLGVLLGGFEPVLAAGNIGRVVALHGQVVEDSQVGASVLTWLLAIEADVELLAILGVGIEGMDDLDTVEFQGVVLGAAESISQGVGAGLATRTSGNILPFADSGVLVEVQFTVASVGLVDATDAQVEDIAD